MSDVQPAELDNLDKKLQDLNVGTEENAPPTSRRVRIFVENDDEEVVPTDDLPPRPSPAEVLERVLKNTPHLNLAGQVTVLKVVMSNHGGSADVYEGELKQEDGTTVKVAVKRLRLNVGRKENIAKDIAREIRVWSEFDHANVLPILGYFLEGNYPSLISQWMTNGSLREYMYRLNKKSSIKMILGIARGLAYIHSRNAIHSDVKSDNILVSPKKEALLTDFGISRMDALSAGYTTITVKGSMRWRAREFLVIPEAESELPLPAHTKQTDVWAFGMTVYEVLTHELPYHHVREELQIMPYIQKGHLPKEPEFSSNPFDKKVDQYLWGICQRCWNTDPKLRPTMASLEDEMANATFYDEKLEAISPYRYSEKDVVTEFVLL